MKNLKVFLFLVCLTLQMGYFKSAMACPCENMVVLDKKVYLETNQIELRNHKIYVNLGGYVYEAPALYSDADGFYIDQIARSGSCSWYQWECSRCGFCNIRGIDWECISCGKAISQ